jgi:spermidine synthase
MKNHAAKRNPPRLYLYLIAFTGGLVSLGAELSASRLLAPHFGDSLPVWAAIIGLILLYLTVGYFVGGRWADRSPSLATLCQLVAWAALLVGVTPFVSRPILLLAARGFAGWDLSISLLVGPFVAVLAIFAVPVTLLGCISPFVVRLLMDRLERAGNVAGHTYAISTAGSLLGTLLPVFVLIPVTGTRNTFVILSLLLMAVGLVGLFHAAPRRALLYLLMPALIAALALGLRNLPVKNAENTIYETESTYHYIRVVKHDEWRYLELNEGWGVHSIYHPELRMIGGAWGYFVVGPFFNPPPFGADRIESLAMVGLAAGTTPKMYTALFGPIPVDGIEIDPEIVRVGRDYFEMDEPNLNALVGDGRAILARLDRRYTVIGIDAYRGWYVPWHLTTVEFFQDVHDHLADDGVAVLNVDRLSDEERLVEALVTTMKEVFASVHVTDIPGASNSIIVATVLPTVPDNLLANQPLMEDPVLQQVAREAYDNVRPPAEAGSFVLTDDRAPVGMLTHPFWYRFLYGDS